MFKFQSKNKYNELIKTTSTNLDLFAQPPQFRILKRDKYNTALGHALTLGMIVLAVVYFALSVQDMVNKSNPSVVYTENQLLDSEPIYLSKQNFTFALTLANLSLAQLSSYNKNYQLSIQNCERKRNVDPKTGAFINITSQCVSYAVEKCEINKHFITDQQKKFFSNVNLTYMYCVNSDQWDKRSLVLQGTLGGNHYQYLTVMATECKNSTSSNITCNPKENITQGLQAGYYALYISDYLNQMNNAGNPFTQIIQLVFQTFSITTSKEYFLFYKYTQTKSDTGLVGKDYKTDFAIIQSTTTQNQNFYNGVYFLYHTISLDFKSGIYTRNYPKLQDILGQIGGLWQVMYFICQLLITPIVIMMLNLQMANKIFTFVHPQSKNDLVNDLPLQSSRQLIASEGNQSSNQQILYSNQELQKSEGSRKGKQTKTIFRGRGQSADPTKIADSKQMKVFVKKRNKSLYLSFKEILLIVFGCRSKEKQLINYASDKIFAKLDVAFILKKLFEIEKMKQLLFDEEQLKLFQYLPKPKIPVNLFDQGNEQKLKELEQIKQFKFILQEEKSDIVKLTEAYQSYLLLSKKQEKSKIDDQLIKQLDQDVLDLFRHIQGGKQRLESLVSIQVLDYVFEDSARDNEEIDENIGVVLPNQQEENKQSNETRRNLQQSEPE